jgi:hypothetical protein
MRGRYPDFDVLEQQQHWDERTREVVLRRVGEVPPLRFFTAEQARTLRAFLDRALAQDSEPRIPVLEMIDAKLHRGELDGWRHADMPADPQTWQLLAQGLDESARAAGAEDFAAAGEERQRELIGRLAQAELTGGVWEALSPERAWAVAMRAALSAFYSHPWAWNEIGFGGPAYPRGYMRMSPGTAEPWERGEALSPDPVPETGHERAPR